MGRTFSVKRIDLREEDIFPWGRGSNIIKHFKRYNRSVLLPPLSTSIRFFSVKQSIPKFYSGSVLMESCKGRLIFTDTKVVCWMYSYEKFLNNYAETYLDQCLIDIRNQQPGDIVSLKIATGRCRRNIGRLTKNKISSIIFKVGVNSYHEA